MLANQHLIIDAAQAGHKASESVLALLEQVCQKLSIADLGTECQQLQQVLKDNDSMFTTLRDASTADLNQMLGDVKKYASDVTSAEARKIEQASMAKASSTASDMEERFKKLEARVLSELATSGDGTETPKGRGLSRGGDGQVMKKVATRLTDFEEQMQSQLQALKQDVEKKVTFVASQPRPLDGQTAPGADIESLNHDVTALRYDLGELRDVLATSKGDVSHIKRVALACERDMEDFTAAMDAVNVDLDEMKARVDSTHSIVTSRQRVEATVTAEISTMRLDMGDMQEGLKAHDAWMEDVSQSLQEAHERCHQLSEEIAELRDQTQAKLDQKTDVLEWNNMNDDQDASIKTVRDMASALRLEVDSRNRKVDTTFSELRSELKCVDEKLETEMEDVRRIAEEHSRTVHAKLDEHKTKHLDTVTNFQNHQEDAKQIASAISDTTSSLDDRLKKLETDLRQQDEDLHKEVNDRIDEVEKNVGSNQKESTKRMNALDLRISGLQGQSGEARRDVNKLRDEVNSLTVKSAAHDVDISKNNDDLRRLERLRSEDTQRHKQDMDAVYEELDQKVYEKNFQGLEANVTKLTRGTVKLCQVIGVFPGQRMGDSSDEADIDVELLNWEDCAQNLTARVEKTWRQLSSQRFRSILDLVSKKADHSVLRLLQISQQHIESQLDRVRHERELWKEVVDKRAQQPLQLALTLKDQQTGLAMGQPGLAPGMPPMAPMQGLPRPASGDGTQGLSNAMLPPGEAPGGQIKPSPLAKRIARPAPPPKA